MPLIRYRTGDLGRMLDEACPCGRPFEVMDAPHGRMDDVIVTPDGRRVGRIDPIFKAVSAIHEAQVVQISEDALVVRIVEGRPFPEHEATKLVEELRLRVGSDMQITIEIVPSIPRTARGKLRMVVNEIAKNGSGGAVED